MTEERIETKVEGGVFEITMNRPKAKNALTAAMYTTMTEAVKAADADGDVCVLRFRGAGGNFSSGNDLKDFLEDPPTGPESPVFKFMHALTACRKPIVAEVEGFAVGIGTTMLFHCDLVYAAEDAKFLMPFVNLHLVPEAACSYLLPRAVGHRRAAELLFFGEPFGPEEAREVGLVNHILPNEGLAAHVDERCEALTKKSMVALRETKELLRSHWREPMVQHLDREAAVFVRLLGTPEVKEALEGFFDKKPKT